MMTRVNLISESGYILLYTLFISFLITSVIFYAIIIVFFFNAQVVKEINKKKLELACFSSVQKHISNLLNPENKNYLVCFDSTNVFLSCRMRGVYYEIKAKSKNHLDSTEVVYLIANKITAPFDNAIIISCPNLRAAVAGNTKIGGNILATSNIFSYVNIPGIETVRREFISGKIYTSQKIKVKAYNESFYTLNKIPNYDVNYKILPGGFVLNTFSLSILDSSKNLIINGDFFLEGKLGYTQKFISNIFVVKGNTFIKSNTHSFLDLQIYSNSSITINDNSIVKNLTSFTQKDIIIKSKCILENVQMFAEKNIFISNSELKYPSTVSIYVNTSILSNFKNEIDINSSKVNGNIMLLSSTTGMGNNQSKILIDEKCTVQGLVYSENYSEISGKIFGIVYTNSFRFYKGPTEYINWLVNLNINREKLNKWFLLPIGLLNKSEFEILDERWIY